MLWKGNGKRRPVLEEGVKSGVCAAPDTRICARTHVIVLCQTRHCDQGASASVRVLLCFFQVAVGIRTTFALAIDDHALCRSEREYAHAAEVHRVDVEGPPRLRAKGETGTGLPSRLRCRWKCQPLPLLLCRSGGSDTGVRGCLVPVCIRLTWSACATAMGRRGERPT